MNNAQNTDVKKQLKVRPIFDPGRNSESRRVKNKHRTLQEKLIVLGRTGKDNNAMLEPLENPTVKTQLAPLFDLAEQNLVSIDGPSRNQNQKTGILKPSSQHLDVTVSNQKHLLASSTLEDQPIQEDILSHYEDFKSNMVIHNNDQNTDADGPPAEGNSKVAFYEQSYMPFDAEPTREQ